MGTRKSICMGSFQYRRTSSIPKPPENPPPDVPPVNPRPSLPPQNPIRHVPVENPRPSLPPNNPIRKKRKTRTMRRPELDRSLPEGEQIACLLEHAFKREFQKKLADASTEDQEQFQTSATTILDCLRNDSNTEKAYAPNIFNNQLSQREAQLKAIVAIYEKELQQWEHVQVVAEQEPNQIIDVSESEPFETPPFASEMEDVLAASTRAVESYILQSDHFRSMLKRFESRNRANHARVNGLAASLNDRVMEELGNDSTQKLIPPPALVNVQTNDLNVSILAGDA